MEKRKEKRKKYSGEFKICVILDKREHYLSCRETVRKYWETKSKAEEDSYRSQVRSWERIYLEKGEAGLMAEKQRKKEIGKPRQKPVKTEVEDDLAAENKRLRERLEYVEAENEYLKKLDALVRAEEQKNGKKRK